MNGYSFSILDVLRRNNSLTQQQFQDIAKLLVTQGLDLTKLTRREISQIKYKTLVEAMFEMHYPLLPLFCLQQHVKGSLRRLPKCLRKEIMKYN